MGAKPALTLPVRRRTIRPVPWTDDIRYHAFAAGGGVLVRAIQCGTGVIADWWDLERVVAPHWALYRNQAPGAVLRLRDGREVALDPGPSWLVPPWLDFGRRVAGRVPHRWIEFDVAGLSPSAVRDVLREPVALPADAVLDGGFAALEARMAAADAPPLHAHLEASALANAALARLWDRLAAPALRRLVLAGIDPRLQPALRRIEDGLADPLYIDGLARLCDLGPAQFRRRFAAATGLSPVQFLIERRLARAAELLTASAEPIEAVATACGFGDRFALTRAFTRRMGLSPAAFRAGHQHHRA